MKQRVHMHSGRQLHLPRGQGSAGSLSHSWQGPNSCGPVESGPQYQPLPLHLLPKSDTHIHSISLNCSPNLILPPSLSRSAGGLRNTVKHKWQSLLTVSVCPPARTQEDGMWKKMSLESGYILRTIQPPSGCSWKWELTNKHQCWSKQFPTWAPNGLST